MRDDEDEGAVDISHGMSRAERHAKRNGGLYVE